MARMWCSAVLLLALGEVVVFGQQPALPQGLIPVPEKPGLAVVLKTDKSTYAPGDRMRIAFTLQQPAYVYIWSITAAGQAQLLVPNRFLQNPYFPAGTHVLPQTGWALKITEPEGMEYLQILAVDRPLSFYDAKAFEKQAFLLFASPAAMAAAVQSALGDAVWGTAWTSYLVRQPKGYVTVVTAPVGAAVWIDGKYVGEAPVRTLVPAGKRSVRVEKTGYAEQQLTVDLGDGEEVQLVLTLEPAWPRPLPIWTPSRPGEGEPAKLDLGVGFNVGWLSGFSAGVDLWTGPLGVGLAILSVPQRPDLSQPGPGGWFPWGPEVEIYLALWVQGANLGLWGSLGLAFQEMAYLPAWYPAGLGPLVQIEPETDWEVRPTWSLGLGTGGPGWWTYVAWHNRRGLVLGFVAGI